MNSSSEKATGKTRENFPRRSKWSEMAYLKA